MFGRQEVALCLVVTKAGAYTIRRYTNSMKQDSFQEAKSHPGSQEIYQIRRDRGFHSTTGIYLENTKPVHILPLYFLNLHFRVTLTRILSSTKWRLSFKFSDQTFVMLISAMLSIVPTRLIFFYFYSQIATFLNMSDKGTLLNVSDKKLGLLSTSVQSMKTTPFVPKFDFDFKQRRVTIAKSCGTFYN